MLGAVAPAVLLPTAGLLVALRSLLAAGVATVLVVARLAAALLVLAGLLATAELLALLTSLLLVLAPLAH